MGESIHQNGEKLGDKSEDSPFPLTDTDRWVLSQTDDEFHLHDWDELKEIIATNNLSILKRKPSDLRRYMSWSTTIKAEYGSMMNYILQHRLPWGSPPFTYISSIPFESPLDYKILLNDWPYGLSKNVTHFVVWSKTPIATDDDKGDVTDESRKIIENFVKRTFADRLEGTDRVMWFKNWVALQSVRALEHIHVLIKDVQKEDIEFWTGNKI
ncbi:uncharacterized protein EAF01_008012 [Botrytis porri]|uniref:N-acetylglucosamine-induced protein 1 n=1 Tax=Botrytis porri TaxID=87229 RepID=A0A4Z1KDP9_9HELO|nr:uncharacterized protein EAF01_008012 [Botrytis porri]KAF7900710.1 hypothetical protein EAF01_008012 [Botrytis porri]TGO83800.1 hypothetical protein BPOR_0591g00040 [Botrytis porri]